MGQTEILGVRAASKNIQVLLELLPGKLRDFTDIEGLRGIRVFRRRELETDLLIRLDWERGGETGKSRPGHLLADFLSHHGMVNHTTWDPVLQQDMVIEGQGMKGETEE